MTQGEALYHLQQTELAAAGRQKRLREIEARLQDNQAVQTAKKQVEKTELRLKPLRQKMKEIEHQIQSTQTRRQNTEERLYSGTVKNPKEMQDMQHEIEALKNWHAELEDRMLEQMVAVEEAEAELEDGQQRLQQAETAREHEHAELLEEKAQLESELAQLQAERSRIVEQIQPENLKLYNQIKPQKGGQPIALLQGDSCSACGIELIGGVAKTVRRSGELVRCTNCKRIVVNLQG